MNVSPRTSLGVVLLWLGLGMLALLMAASLAVLGPWAMLICGSLAAAAVFVLMLQLRPASDRYWMFLLMFALPVLLAMARKTLGVGPFGAWQFLVLLLAFFGLRAFWEDIRTQPLLQLFLFVFFLFLAVGLLSTLYGRSHLYGFVYQLISDLKPILALALGYALLWNASMEKLLWLMVRWFWIPCLALVAFEWLAPGIYYRLFNAVGGRGLSVDPTGLLPSRASGLFEHPSFLAASGALFALLAAARAMTIKERRWQNWFFAGANFLLIICAVQRQEMAGCLLAGMAVFALAQPGKVFGRLVSGAVLGVVAAATFWMVFGDNLVAESQQWGYQTYGPLVQPRAQIFSGAWTVAEQYAPFGSGLGTYGGAGAEKFDHSLYARLGFGRYWWYGKEDYLMDTYWPNSIAETGILGASLLLLSYLVLLIYAVKRAAGEASPRARAYWLSAMAMMLYMIMLSFSSPAFQDLRLFILPAMMFGIASAVSKESYENN
jgi:hypothetical protein